MYMFEPWVTCKATEWRSSASAASVCNLTTSAVKLSALALHQLCRTSASSGLTWEHAGCCYYYSHIHQSTGRRQNLDRWSEAL